MKTRGLRNNNPGNIRKNNIRYDGEMTISTDDQFKQFNTMEHGYRAMFTLLYTYQKRYGLTCIEQFIMRYAPPVENHTNVYIKNVCRWSGFSRNAPLSTITQTDMMPVVAAMSRVENGVEADSLSLFKGWQMFAASYNK